MPSLNRLTRSTLFLGGLACVGYSHEGYVEPEDDSQVNQQASPIDDLVVEEIQEDVEKFVVSEESSDQVQDSEFKYPDPPSPLDNMTIEEKIQHYIENFGFEIFILKKKELLRKKPLTFEI